uniref:Zinc finger protein 385C n=1 Tax=Erpetoichthys calabaricus TaxID=27687 RepID=A0A8C4TQC3_ERPCA
MIPTPASPLPSGPLYASGPLLATLPIAGRPLQPQLDLKHFMPFRLNGSSPMSLFPNFNTMDPVQKAVINHTFGIPPPLKKKQIISCNICHLRFNSTNQAEAHYKGHKHARKLKAMEAQKNKQRNPNAGTSAHGEPRPPLTPCPDLPSLELTVSSSPLISPNSQLSETVSEGSAMSRLDPGCEMVPTDARRGTVPSGKGDNDRSKKSKQHLHCPACKVTVNSVSQLEAHNSGAKHKSVLEGQTSQPRRRSKVPSSRSLCKTKRIGNKGSLGVQSKAFHCEVCAIYVNSDTQLKQHMNSRRHKDRLAGKPPKPKYSPYNKSQQSTILTVSHADTKLALQKQLTKTLTPGFLPSPLSPAALCTMAASPLTLRHPAGTTTTLIQTPFLGPALFRPAPGPLRAAHTPILFAPY